MCAGHCLVLYVYSSLTLTMACEKVSLCRWGNRHAAVSQANLTEAVSNQGGVAMESVQETQDHSTRTAVAPLPRSLQPHLAALGEREECCVVAPQIRCMLNTHECPVCIFIPRKNMSPAFLAVIPGLGTGLWEGNSRLKS